MLVSCNKIKRKQNTVKSFRVPRKKRRMKRENIPPHRIFCNLKMSNQTQIGQIEFFSDISKAVLQRHIFTQTEVPLQHLQHGYAVCLNHENTSEPKSTCFASWTSLVLLSKMRAPASTALLFPNTVGTVGRECPSSFVMPARFRFGSRLVL